MIMMHASRFMRLPIYKTLRHYHLGWLRHDILAGITVAAIAIPQAMAYANLAGVPLVAGLYAALVGMVVYAVFSSSRRVIAGPDAAVAALAGATIIPLAHGDIGRAGALVALLSILIGIACLTGMAARIGFMAEFLSRPILLGYMAGLALVVIASQLPSITGVGSNGSVSFFSVLHHLSTHLESVNSATVGLSLLSLSAYMFFTSFISKVPASILLLLGGTVASAAFDLSKMGIRTIGAVPTGLPLPNLPAINLGDMQNLIVPALAIMLIAYANTIATARSFAAKRGEKIDTTQEFTGLGFANIGSGLFGGLPIAASGARTAVNDTSRAHTQVSQLVAAIVIALALLLFAPLLRYTPVCVLAVIIISAIIKLFDIAELRSIWHAWRTEALLAIATVLGVTILGIMQGLLLAVALAIANLIRQSATPYDAVLGVTKTGAIRDMDRPPRTTSIPGLLMYRFDAPLYFANSNYFKERVLYLIAHQKHPVQWFLWDAETITSIDSTAGKMLAELVIELRSRDVVFAIARMKGSVREVVDQTTHLSLEFESSPHYTTLGRAIEAFTIVRENPDTKPLKEKAIMARRAAMNKIPTDTN